jgi:hypothetical protein
VRRFGLVTPYVDDVQQAIIDNHRRAGFAGDRRGRPPRHAGLVGVDAHCHLWTSRCRRDGSRMADDFLTGTPTSAPPAAAPPP